MREFFQTLLLRFSLCALAATLALLVIHSKTFRDACAKLLALWRGMTALGRTVAVLVVSVFVVYASTKTNTPPLRVVRPLSLPRLESPTVTAADIDRGYRQVSVATNEDASFAMPSNATIIGNWHKRGTFGEWMRLDFGDFAFPLGRNGAAYSAFSVFSDGKIRPTPRDTAHEICAVGSPLLALQGESRFWTAEGANDSKILTWENFFLNADTNAPVNAQIKLSPAGDFTVRTNAVETAYARICPQDWDGDGIPNNLDENPCAFDGDYNGPANVLPPGANTNAYCTVSLVASGPDTRVTFSGDAPSDYPDPDFIAKSGVTNEVMILIGKSYTVSSDEPLALVGVSDPATEVWQPDATWRLGTVCRPVSISSSEGSPFTMSVEPANLSGTFVWEPTGCGCAVSGSGNLFSFTCPMTCTCCGTSAYGSYVYEGYSLPVSGGLCGCHYDGTGPRWETAPAPLAASVTASFSKPAVIFEDPYENLPGQWVPRRSTRTRLNIVANGGPNGGTLTVTTADLAKLTAVSGPVLPLLPVTVPPETQVTYSIVYEGAASSGAEGDVVVTAALQDADTTDTLTSADAQTSIRLELSPIWEAPENPCTNRHVYGVGEKIACRHEPLSVDGTWRIEGLEGFNSLGLAEGCDAVLTLSFIGSEVPDLRFCASGAEYAPLLQMIVPEGVVCRAARWDGRSCARGLSGGFGMVLRLYVLPMNVSFQGIDMREDPCTEVIPPSGYYAGTNYNGALSHTLDAGAGWWHHVHSGNYWTEDNPYAAARYPPFAQGVMNWKIPISWNQRFDDELSWPRSVSSISQCRIGSSAWYRQTFSMSDNGTVSVAKFGHVADRTTNDVVRIDGSVVHDGD